MRKYYDVYITDWSERASEAIRRIELLYAIGRDIREQARCVRRQQCEARSAPILAELREWLLHATQRTVSVKSPLSQSSQYTLTRRAALTR